MTEFLNNIVTIRQLHFARNTHDVLDGVDLDIPRKKITAIMGPSGTGKTTLIRLIGGELKPQSGSILIDNQNVPDLKRRELYLLRRRMGVLFQEGGLFTDFNVFENVAFPLREHTNLPQDMIADLVYSKLEAVGLRGAAKLRIDELSGGMARRVALARAIILDPEIMIYDEPFVGQDPIMRGILLNLIKKLNDTMGLSSIVISHDVQETAQIADYVYIISSGKIMGQGTPAELLQNEAPPIRQFVQGLPDGPIPFRYPARPIAEDLDL